MRVNRCRNDYGTLMLVHRGYRVELEIVYQVLENHQNVMAIIFEQTQSSFLMAQPEEEYVFIRYYCCKHCSGFMLAVIGPHAIIGLDVFPLLSLLA